MRRYIEPPKDQWDLLPTKLTKGERAVAELFDAKLPPAWEIYIQPHLNGLRPDIVLLNPMAGIAVFEIKDWAPSTLESKVSQTPTQNPIRQIKLYKEDIFYLFCPRLDDKSGLAAITSGLIFTKIPQAEVSRILSPTLDEKMRSYPNYYPFSGSERVEKRNVARLFPESSRYREGRRSFVMSLEAAEDLRGWLKEPDFKVDPF